MMQQNAKKYFEKYNKMKRTYEALSELTIQVKEEIDHLESILSALDIALLEEDLLEIRLEREQYGYLKKKYQGKGNKKGHRLVPPWKRVFRLWRILFARLRLVGGGSQDAPFREPNFIG